jgi:hypothetical protein
MAVTEEESPHGIWPRAKVSNGAWFIPLCWGSRRTVAHYYADGHGEEISFPLQLCRPLFGVCSSDTGEPVVFAPGNAPRCKLCDRKLNRTRRSQ